MVRCVVGSLVVVGALGALGEPWSLSARNALRPLGCGRGPGGSGDLRCSVRPGDHGYFCGSWGPGIFGGAQEYLGALGGLECFQGPRALGTLVFLGAMGALEALVV